MHVYPTNVLQEFAYQVSQVNRTPRNRLILLVLNCFYTSFRITDLTNRFSTGSKDQFSIANSFSFDRRATKSSAVLISSSSLLLNSILYFIIWRSNKRYHLRIWFSGGLNYYTKFNLSIKTRHFPFISNIYIYMFKTKGTNLICLFASLELFK